MPNRAEFTRDIVYPCVSGSSSTDHSNKIITISNIIGTSSSTTIQMDNSVISDKNRKVKYSKAVFLAAKIFMCTFVVGVFSLFIGVATGKLTISGLAMFILSISAISLVSWVEIARNDKKRTC